MNHTNEYLSWKANVFSKLPDLITSADIGTIISKSTEFVNDAIVKRQIRSVPYYGKRIVAPDWLSDYLDSIEHLFDPETKTFRFPEEPKGQVCEKKKRHTIDYSQYSSFEELLEDFEDELTVQDIGHILGQHPDTVRRNMYKGRIRFKKKQATCIIEKRWFLDYVAELGISYNERVQSRDERRDRRLKDVVEFCLTPKTIYEIMEFTGITCKVTARKYIIKPLMKQKKLRFTCKAHDNNQKYIAR